MQVIGGLVRHKPLARALRSQRVEGEKARSSLAFPLAGTFTWACFFPSFSCQAIIV